MHKESDSSTYVKVKRLQRAGHVQRLPVYRIPKQALRVDIYTSRRVLRRGRDGKIIFRTLPAYFNVVIEGLPNILEIKGKFPASQGSNMSCSVIGFMDIMRAILYFYIFVVE